MAAQHRTDAELQAIKAAAADLFAALSAGEPAGGHDLRLHRSIAVASHNSIIPLTLDGLTIGEEGLVDSILAVAARHHEDRARSLQFEHAAVVEAIERCEPDMAETAMRLHLMRARSRARLL
jgi:GntR family transcriptional regulator, transcriptional repressor for pyruvate dehydrogenase complex